jgi:hypothetical protein
VDPLFPLTFFVLGSLQYFNRGEFAGRGFVCSNPHHQQPGLGYARDSCLVNKPKGYHSKIKKMKPSKGLQVGLCRSKQGYLAAPETDFIRIPSGDVARLNVFVVVLKEWVNFDERLVIIPEKLQMKIKDRVQQTFSTKNIFEVNEDDYQYFASSKTDMLANRHHWCEYSFNNCIGPLITLADAVSVRDVMNKMFVDDMGELKMKLKSSLSAQC